MTNGMDSPPGGPLNVWHAASQPPPVGNQQWRPLAAGTQQWRSPVPAASPVALPLEYRPSHSEPPTTSARHSTSRRFVDRPSFWYLLMFVAFVLLLLSFWVWNRPTATQLGMSIPIPGGWAA